ncbi:MAG: bacteriohemerythrin [Proteobacteria bacterium]|nr:bacteriohemerythrin [Pseudomonadota bacterium]MBU1716063.1 bacteriohemerythrin [Pseudomonadota bacterium]
MHEVARERSAALALPGAIGDVGPGPAVTVDEDALKEIMFKLTLVYLFVLAIFACLLLLVARIRTRQFGNLVDTQRSMVFALASLAELRDQATGKHLERTRSYGVILGGRLRRLAKYRQVIDDQFIDNLYDAAPLHDIGKVAIPDHILLKPGPLTDEEFVLMKSHAEIGGQILSKIIERLDDPLPFLVMSRNIACYHHERYDGSGYPEGLAGDAIPLEAQIYALCDTYDAIRSKRPYKGPVTHMEAVQRLMVSRGSHFAPDVVNAFIDCEEQLLELFESYQVYDEVYQGFFDNQSGGGPAVVWSSEFEVGVELIDRQHQELINRINSLIVAIREGRGREETFMLMRFLQGYVVEHFRTEEGFMLRHHYAEYEAHKEIHDAFIADLDQLAATMESTGIDSDLVVDVNQKVINWLVAHIFLIDKGLRNCLTSSE